MPQDNPHTESERPENTRQDRARAERVRSERSSTASLMSPPFGEMGTRNVKAGLRMQKEIFDLLQDIGREWFARATSEAELAFKLPERLTAAQTIPDAFSAYQEWLSEWMNRFSEDSRRFLADSRTIADTGVRCLSGSAPAVTS
jgi:hypothetical protein